MKISEWLSGLNSHDIYDAEFLRQDLLKRCGEKAPWKGASHAEVKKAMEARGLGGTLAADKGQRMIVGFEVAEDLAHMKGIQYQYKHGRGSRFWSILAAIKEAGL